MLLAAVSRQVETTGRLATHGPVSYRDAALKLMAYACGEADLDGVWDRERIFDGNGLQVVLPSLPKGPAFKEVRERITIDVTKGCK